MRRDRLRRPAASGRAPRRARRGRGRAGTPGRPPAGGPRRAGVGPEADAQAGQDRGAQGRRFGLRAAAQGEAQQVGLELEERVGAGHPAVDAEVGQGRGQVGVRSRRSGRRPGRRPLRAWRGRGRRRSWRGSGRRSSRGRRAPSAGRPGRSGRGRTGRPSRGRRRGTGGRSRGRRRRPSGRRGTTARPPRRRRRSPPGAYCGGPSPRVAARVVIRPRVEGTGVAPVWASRNAPVPYVHLACPAARHPWPTSDACWSPATPGDRQAVGQVVEARGSGRTRRRSGGFRAISRRGRRRSRRGRRPSAGCAGPSASVREALVASVTCRRAAGQVPDQQAVDGPRGQLAGLGAASGAGDVVEQPGDLGGREVRVEHQARSARRSRRGGRGAARRSRPCGGPARRSPGRSPGRSPRSQTTVVSRWLVRPMAASRSAPSPALGQRPRRRAARPSRRGPRGRARPSPASGRSAATSAWAWPTGPEPRVVDDGAGAGRPLVDRQQVVAGHRRSLRSRRILGGLGLDNLGRWHPTTVDTRVPVPDPPFCPVRRRAGDE